MKMNNGSKFIYLVPLTILENIVYIGYLSEIWLV